MISIISTVYNEGESIARLMESFITQTRQADEIVIVDGGSTDNTVAVMERYKDKLPLRIILEPGCNISEGRNCALAAVQGDIIVATDAGVRLTDGWLEAITQPLLDNAELMVSAGFFAADPHSAFEVAMGATTLPLVDEINPESFLPSSRSVAFRKTASDAIGGYPEWLDYCEDLVFDLRLKMSTPPFAFAPQALVYFRPRASLRAYFKQYYLYARGDGKADLWRKRHFIRYITYLVVIPLVFALGILVHALMWGLYVVGGAAYLYQPYRRLSQIMRANTFNSPLSWLYVALLIPVIRVVGDVAKMIGYPVGLVWRWRNRPPNWRQLP